ncbi:hypothetical protein [Actinoplanes sp. N902-109]|uniref:hypothetical protein n=1 Tax=Actinoplanes sp. (strain N902-109) TaxID=649831 RepID=UPI0012FA0B8F|nr:hypothetical protein [Actinoplanes sp. N902-109]
MFAAAVTMRVLMISAYPYAFFFADSRPYVAGAYNNIPYPARPFGYSILLKPFVPGPLDRVAVAQHLLALALIAASYVFLVRRGVWTWLAALAVLPLALDARELTLEHFVLAETAYVALTAAALMLLAWRSKVGWAAATIGGLLLGFAAITRSVGLPVIGLALVYLIVRRAGWLRILAFAVTAGLVLAGYMFWYHLTYQVYAMGQYQGRFLYARVMTIADCPRLDLTPQQRTLCLQNPPPEWKQRPDAYIWNPQSPANLYYKGTEHDPFLNEFAKTVIKQQPLDFAGMVLDETSWHLRWRAPLNSSNQCAMDRWLPPEMPGEQCNASYYLNTPSPLARPEATMKVPNPDGARLRAYGKVMTTPGPLYAAAIVIALFAAVFRPRRVPWRDAADALLLVGAGFGVIVGSVATSIFDYRYSIPAVLLIPLGSALAIKRIVAASRRTPQGVVENHVT